MINWIVRIIKRLLVGVKIIGGIDLHPDKVVIHLVKGDKYHIKFEDASGKSGEFYLDGPGNMTFPAIETVTASPTVIKETVETWSTDYLALRARFPNEKIERVSEGPGIESCFWKVSGTWEAEPEPPKQDQIKPKVSYIFCPGSVRAEAEKLLGISE